jgi:HEAT repeat protein
VTRKEAEPPDIKDLADAGDVEGLVEALDARFGSEVRCSAADVLADLRDPRSVEALIANLDDGDESVVVHAIAALAKVGDVRSVESLVQRLDRPDTRAAIYSMFALAEHPPPGSVERLVEVVNDDEKNDKTREMAAEALARMNDESAASGLRSALVAPETQFHALAGLADLGENRGEIDPALLELLVPMLRHPDWHVRGHAVSALGGTRDSRAVKPLIAALEDDIYDVRRRAVLALGQIGDSRAIRPLRRAATKESQQGDWIRSRIESDFGHSGASEDAQPGKRRWWQLRRGAGS